MESTCNGLGVAGGQPQLFLPSRSSEWPLLVMGQVERADHNRPSRDARGLEKSAASMHKFQGAWNWTKPGLCMRSASLNGLHVALGFRRLFFFRWGVYMALLRQDSFGTQAGGRKQQTVQPETPRDEPEPVR